MLLDQLECVSRNFTFLALFLTRHANFSFYWNCHNGFFKFEWNKNIQLVDILSQGMTNRTENSRNFQISGKKDDRLSIYLILYWKFRLNSPVHVIILIGRWKQWSFDGLDKKDTRRPREQICLPVDNCMLAAVSPVPGNSC